MLCKYILVSAKTLQEKSVAVERVSDRQVGALRGVEGPGMRQWETRSAHSDLVWRFVLLLYFIRISFALLSIGHRLVAIVFYRPLASVSTDVKALLTRLGYFGDVFSCDELPWIGMQPMHCCKLMPQAHSFSHEDKRQGWSPYNIVGTYSSNWLA